MVGLRPGLLLYALLHFSQQPSGATTRSSLRPARILVLYAHSPKAGSVDAFSRGLFEALRAERGDQDQIYTEALTLDRPGSEASWPALAAHIESKYHGIPFDAIVTEGTRALEFAMNRLHGAHPGIPILYGAAYEPTVNVDALPANVIGRHTSLPFAKTFQLARTLQPDADRVVLVVGSTALDSTLINYALQDIRPHLGTLRLEVLRDWSFASLLQTLHEQPKGTFVILSAFGRDWTGQTFNPTDLIPSLSRAASVPVYGVSRQWIEAGLVGGAGIDFADDGASTGRLLAAVLERDGTQPFPGREEVNIPLLVEWDQLRRWGIPTKRVPSEALMLNREPTWLRRNWAALLIALAVFAVESLLISLLVIERRKRVRAQQSLHQQIGYELMIGGLKLDAARHAPDDSSGALDQAVARLGDFSGARSVELRVQDDSSDESIGVTRWSRASTVTSNHTRNLEIPLRVDDVVVGTLVFDGLPAHHTDDLDAQARLEGAAELLSAALGRAAASRALAESRDHVAHISRVATIGQLGAAVSHELHQPLTAILANAEAGALLLAKDPPDVREAREAFRDIVADHTRAMEVIEYVRMLLRRERAANQSVSLNDVCQKAAKLLQREASIKDVTLDLFLAERLPCVRGDSVQLQQVVMNLVLNAIESAATSTKQRRVTITTTGRASQVELVVKDTGPGLTGAVKDQLFKSFFSTKKGGIGMGLAIVNQIVKRHGGQVHGANMVDGGALFRVTLPARAAV
jgi:C4-dicarboxylate-specific signal transduction histidine kinase